LSRFNQTFFHLPRQHSCPCNVHYLYNNPDIYLNKTTYSTVKYHTNYLRLTPICLLNETTSIFEQYQNTTEQIRNSNTTDFILQGLEDKCDYKLIFLDCDAMTTTTTTTEITSNSENISYTTKEIPTTTTTLWFVILIKRIIINSFLFLGILNIQNHQKDQEIIQKNYLLFSGHYWE
jgi:hypothetical protein